LASTLSPQRAWRAACPNCGAPVEFRSAASASAVCGFCKSTLLRDGESLRRIGRVGELFDDHSPLALGANGRLQGEGFALVGRLQYRYDGGTWNEWRALFDSGKTGWLSEDNGSYVFAFDLPLDGEVPAAAELVAGERRLVGGQAWDVASVTRVALISAQGELAKPPNQREPFIVADLRNAQGEVATLDYSDAGAVGWSIGKPVELASLSLVGLAVAQDGSDTAEKTLAARALECPSCGANLEVTLASTQSIVCHQCRAVVDVSQGAGADIAAANRNHYGQDTPSSGAAEPLIPLGATGSLALGGPTQRWQVVGYVERHTVPGPGDDGESWFWREYLLYHRSEGFAFLVDAEDGWSWVRTISGAPQRVDGSKVKWRGIEYRQQERYTGEIGYVLGEFYWKLERGARTDNTDYAGTGANGKKRLNREQTSSGATQEVTWSAGETMDGAQVLQAFGLGGAAAAFARDAKPVAGRGGSPIVGFFIFMLLIAVVFSMVRCSRDDCGELKNLYGEASSEYQQCKRTGGASGVRWGGSGGSFGGYSSGGGGHK